ncbi:hypothetical protein NXS19_000144 [Fusarium pseudograminearum]|nr:hypothetical protein NXS19_000144 [Fusarium pseudograminearum]
MQENASHIPSPDSDVELPSRLLDTSEVYVGVQSWLPEPSKNSIPGLAGTVFGAILALFIPLARYVEDDKDGKHIAIGSRNLLHEVERLFLWGDGFSASDGQLDEILSKSSELRESVLSSLYELGVTLKNIALRTCYTSESNKTRGLDAPMRELQGLLEQTSILLYGSDSLDGRDAMSESGSSTTDLSECFEDITAYIDCLMDLSVALENPVLDLETVDATIPSFQNLETFDVSSSQALTFCRKVRDRFPKMEKWLVERLGENNARRASALKEARERCLDIETASSTDLANPVFEQSNINSSRRPVSTRRFAHIPASNASLSTIASSITDSRPRVPPLPEEALEDKPFSCLACHQKIAHKMTPKDWKRHIFSDLSSYTCTIRTCRLETKLYSSTRGWVEHETQHRPQDWQGSECPFFCDRKSTLTSPESYYKHVAEHLREVSLAALPHGHDSDAEASDSDGKSKNGDDWATVSNISETRETGPISEPPRRGKRKRSDEVADKDLARKTKKKRKRSEKPGKRRQKPGKRRQKPRETAKTNPPLTNQERAELFMSLVTKGPESERGSSLSNIMKRFHRARKTPDLDTTKMVEAKQLWRDLRLRQNERGEVIVFAAGSQSGRGEEHAAIANKSTEIDGSCAVSKAAVESEEKNKME